MKELLPHKDLVQLLPPLAADDYQRLKADIGQNGIRIPIIHNVHGLIVDGWNRYKIARELGIDPPLDEQTFENEIEAGVQLNLARRHLSAEQKREMIGKLRKLGWTQKKVSKTVGLSRSRVSEVENINIVDSDITHIPDVRIKIPPKQYPQILTRSEAGETQEQIAADYGADRFTGYAEGSGESIGGRSKNDKQRC